MENQSRRNLIKNSAKAAAVAAGAAITVKTAPAQSSSAKKKAYTTDTTPPAANAGPAVFSPSVSYGNLLFLSGIGYHEKSTVEVATKNVLDELEKNLIAAGSSMEKVLKVNVYLNDVADWAKMNSMYAGRFGKVPPARTTVAPAGGIPGNSLVEIDCVAYI
jgi:2-iminobutanoate/2-iminopropanoate deaminase